MCYCRRKPQADCSPFHTRYWVSSTPAFRPSNVSPSVVSKYKPYHPFVMTTGYPAPSRSAWEFLEIFEHLLVVTSHVMLYHVAPRYNAGHFSRLLSPRHGWPQSTDTATGLAPQGDLELHTWARQKETTVQKRQVYSCDLKGRHYCPAQRTSHLSGHC